MSAVLDERVLTSMLDGVRTAKRPLFSHSATFGPPHDVSSPLVASRRLASPLVPSRPLSLLSRLPLVSLSSPCRYSLVSLSLLSRLPCAAPEFRSTNP